jgi:hypothetical protein
MIKNISSFSQIDYIKPRTLIVLDIDETIMRFQQINEEWWDDIYNKLLPSYKENTYIHVELIWLDYVTNTKPILLDKDNFYIFFENIINKNCEIIFLTARDKSSSLMTIRHLKECGIDAPPSKIFYSRDKGNELKYIVTTLYPNIQDILFIDDLEKNLVNIQNIFNKKELTKYNLKLYKIKHN